jgi:hypothetical protein
MAKLTAAEIIDLAIKHLQELNAGIDLIPGWPAATWRQKLAAFEEDLERQLAKKL